MTGIGFVSFVRYWEDVWAADLHVGRLRDSLSDPEMKSPLL